MTPESDSDEEVSFGSDDDTAGTVSNLPNWMQRGSNSYASASLNGSASDTDSDAGSETGGTRRISSWMRPSGTGSTPAYSNAARVPYTDSDSDAESDGPNDLGAGQDNNSGRNFRDVERHQEYQATAPLRNRRHVTFHPNVNVNNGNPNIPTETFLDEGVVNAYGQGHRHGATVYDDWGLPISNPSNFREGRNMCRPWLVAVNLFAIGLVLGIIIQGGPSSDYKRGRYNWLGQEIMEAPETTWDYLGEELVGPIPDSFEADNRLVGFGHHVAINERGDRLAVARTSGHRNKPGEVYVYSWRDGASRKHNYHPPKPGKWRLEQILTAELDDDDLALFHVGQQHTPLAMSASGHRIAFTEGDHVFVFESAKTGDLWELIAKVQSLDHDAEDEAAAAADAEAKQSAVEQAEQEKAELKQAAVDEETLRKVESGQTTVAQDAINIALSGLDGADEESTVTKSESQRKEEEGDDYEDGERRRKLQGYEWTRGNSHFGKHLAFSHDGKTLAVMGFSRAKGGYIRVFQDETEDIVNDGQDEIHHIFEATPDIFLEEIGDSLTLSGDGKILAIGIATSDDMGRSGTHNGVVQVFGVEDDDEWYRIGQPIFGDYPMEGFGGSVSLSENGLVLAAGVAYGGGPVKIFEVVETDHFGKKWSWNQIGQTLHGDNHRDHFGSQVKLNYDGSVVAIGAPGSPELLQFDEPIDDDMEQYLHGKAYRFYYDDIAHEWQSGGHAVSAYEGDAFGYALALSGDGERVIVGAPFRIVDDEINVGVVEVFGTDD